MSFLDNPIWFVRTFSKKIDFISANGTQCCFDCCYHLPRCCGCCCCCCCRKTGQGCDRSRGPDCWSLRCCCSPWQAKKSLTIIQSLNYEDRSGRDRFFTFFLLLLLDKLSIFRSDFFIIDAELFFLDFSSLLLCGGILFLLKHSKWSQTYFNVPNKQRIVEKL